MGDLDRATAAYEAALRMNPYSIPAMNSISCILRTKEQFPKAVEYLQSILNMDSSNGEIWGSLGHCYLMMDDLQKAYSAYQQALYHLRDPKVRNRPLATVESELEAKMFLGTEIMVRNRYSLRSIRVSGTRRRSVFTSDADGAELREGQ
jgi:tetratricopeptide (TPR) repeat protein